MTSEDQERDESENESSAATAATATDASAADGEAEDEPKLVFDVEIKDTGPCRKHLKVTIPHSEIERQFDSSLVELRREAAMPGFRTGRAPRQLVQKRYRKEVSGQVKSKLLLACMERLDADYNLNPITQPKLDIEAMELPENGPFSFEMDLEVRPDFAVPDYSKLKVKRPVRTVTKADIDDELTSFLERYGQLVPKFEGVAEPGDVVTANVLFHKDGVQVNQIKECSFRLTPELRLQDGYVPGLEAALKGAKPGEIREAKAHIGSGSSDPALRGQTLDLTIQVLDLKRHRLPEVNKAFFEKIGFESEEELRDALKSVLERRYERLQRAAIRSQVVEHLAAAVPFDLPPDLVKRQERATSRHLIEEARRSGLPEAQLRAREAEIRANAHEQTLRSLKELFLLSKIAESHDIKVEDEDVDLMIDEIAERTDDSPRRIRARLQKEGMIDSLYQQILERKTLDKIEESIEIEDVAVATREEQPAATIDASASTLPEPTDEEEEAEKGSGVAAENDQGAAASAEPAPEA